MSSLVFVKIILLLLAGWARFIGGLPPNPPAKEVNKSTYFEILGPRVVATISTSACLALTLLECITILAASFPSNTSTQLLSTICSTQRSSLPLLHRLSPLFLLGTSMMVSSAFLRLRCYRVLGEFFTFEVTIKSNHKLVTAGPYSNVRHPGYTATMLTLLGALAVYLSPNSFIWECDIMSTPARWLVRAWVAWTWFCIVSFFRRGRLEDGLLKKRFGDVWTKYSQDVPCRYIPWIV